MNRTGLIAKISIKYVLPTCIWKDFWRISRYFVSFWEFRGISRKYLNFAGPRPREISEALIQGILLQCIQGTVLTLFSVLRAGCPLNRGTTVSNVSISTNNQQMHFSALKFQEFLGKHAPRRRPPQKRGTYGPLVGTGVYSLYFDQLAT